MAAAPRLAGSLVAICLLAGCASPAPTGSVSSKSPHGDGEVEVAGELFHYGDGWLVNLTARNVGDRTLGWVAPFCASPEGWTARLLGPAGDDLVYRHGDVTMGCPAKAGAMPPGAWLNWTWPHWGSPCSTDTVCDNIWDGRLRGCDGCSPAQEPYDAPAGTYRWVFTFAYQDEPGVGQSGKPGSPRHEVSLAFDVEVP